MAERELHSAVIHASPLAGVEAMDLVSARAFPRHAHDQIGFGFLVAGAQRSWSGRGQVDAGPGQVITTNPGEIHDGAPLAAPYRTWRMIYLDPVLASQHLGGSSLEISCPVIEDVRLRSAVLALVNGAAAGQRSESLVVEETLAYAVALLAARYGGTWCGRSEGEGRLDRALARLHDDLVSAVTLEELAMLEGLSRFQLLRSFVRRLGVTPHAYQTQLRVRLARRLLASGRPPAAVAADAGFADQSHLNRVFVRHVGVSPGRYRAAVSSVAWASSAAPRARGPAAQ